MRQNTHNRKPEPRFHPGDKVQLDISPRPPTMEVVQVTWRQGYYRVFCRRANLQTRDFLEQDLIPAEI